MDQWLRLGAPNAGGASPMPGQGIRFYLLQLMNSLATRKIKDLNAAAKTQSS